MCSEIIGGPVCSGESGAADIHTHACSEVKVLVHQRNGFGEGYDIIRSVTLMCKQHFYVVSGRGGASFKLIV